MLGAHTSNPKPWKFTPWRKGPIKQVLLLPPWARNPGVLTYCISGGFPKLGVPFGGFCNRDHSILGSILESPHFGKLISITYPFEPYRPNREPGKR